MVGMDLNNNKRYPAPRFWKICPRKYCCLGVHSVTRPKFDISILYPGNVSLQEEFVRLFANDPNWNVVMRSNNSSPWSLQERDMHDTRAIDSIQEDFKLNGRDSEYCPELERPCGAEEKNSPTSKLICGMLFSNIFTQSRVSRKTCNTQTPVDQICVFCKNNEYDEASYRSHVIKDVNSKVTCPVLRAYTCPICFATGDGAHTLRYCPRKRTYSIKPLKHPIKNQRARFSDDKSHGTEGDQSDD